VAVPRAFFLLVGALTLDEIHPLVSGAAPPFKQQKHLHESPRYRYPARVAGRPRKRAWRHAAALSRGTSTCLLLRSTTPVVPLDTELYSGVVKLIPSKCLMHALPSALQAHAVGSNGKVRDRTATASDRDWHTSGILWGGRSISR